MAKALMPLFDTQAFTRWVIALPLDDLRKLSQAQHGTLRKWMEKIILEKEHYAHHLRDDCPVCQHLKHHRVKDCYLCEEERHHV